jgi:hypothetical protein
MLVGMSGGYGDIEGQIHDVGHFAARLRRARGTRRWVAIVLVALFAVPLGIAVLLGIVEAISGIF